MKSVSTLYWKIFAVFMAIILALGSIYIWIAAKTVIVYYEETNQRLHAAVATQIAADSRPLINGTINKPVVQKLFHNAMILNPGAEIYLLDPEGKILSYSAPDSVVKSNVVSLGPIRQFISSHGSIFIEGDNPRHEGSKKSFSAAAISSEGSIRGYIYVILGGDQYESVTAALLNSYRLRLAAWSIAFTILAALLIGLAAFLFITKDLNRITAHVRRFQSGNWDERIHIDAGGDLGLLASTFNNMAATLADNLKNMKALEQSRLELIANVSHDLRTPLAVIQGYAETLHLKKDTLSEEEKAHYTRILVNSSTNLGKLVDELFELSKLEAKAAVPHFEQFSIAELLLDNVLKYRILADEKNISIHASIPEDIPMVWADVGMIDRVLQNLVGNAIKFTPAGGDIIAALTHIDGLVEVSITDTGVGISPEKLPGIFDRYVHADTSGSGKGGIGLGLAIIQKILELHQTTIKVKSKVVEGSIFYFSLPVAKEKK